MTLKIDSGNGAKAEIASTEDIDLGKEVVGFERERLTEARAEPIAREIGAWHARKGSVGGDS